MVQELDIPGYKITGEISRSSGKVWAKAISTDEATPVLLKIVEYADGASIETARMRREVSIMEQYSADAILKPYKLLNLKNAIVLVMEDFGASTLHDLAPRFPLPTNVFLQVSLTLTTAVAELHMRGITHSLLHPGIILFSPDGNHIKITDLESASLLTDEFTGFINLHNYDRSLLYMAPEQSGRMNRSVDFRSNLYSLGVIFYEMLTGKPVFESDDIVEIVHAHIAKPPVPPSHFNPAILPVLEQIVLKLLNKNAEERYQTTAGLLADLNHCTAQLDRTGTISDFTIAQEDFAQKLCFPQRLYGRDTEITKLLEGFELVSTGQFAITLVAGYSGIGKSALVYEVHKPILKHRGYFVSGKYDQLKKNIPYSALLQSLKQLTMQVLSEPEANVEKWKKLLTEKLAGNGKLLIEVIPELELLIGKQPDLSDLPVAESQNRFRDTLATFVTAFASVEHPLTLFIDDLQWADSSTIQFMNRLAEDANNGYLYFIGAYRDNEVDGSHPLTIALHELAEKKIAVEQIILKPLSFEHLHQFIADTLKSSLAETKELAKLIEQKTGANPFFTRTFISNLVDENLISYDTKSNRWTWSIQQVQQAQMTDNVVEMMSRRIQKINHESQQLLKIASCLGSSFDLKSLAIITHKTQQQTAKVLWQSLTSGFLFPLDSNYKTAETMDEVIDTHRVKYRFAHDRVQQAAYSLLSEDERLQTHLQIARTQVQVLSAIEMDELVYDVANHYNQALPIITDKAELQKVKEINLRGAKKACEAVAYPVALQLLKYAVHLFDLDCWQQHYAETADAYLALSECYYMTANYAEAEKLYALIEQKVNNKKHFARLYDIMLRQYSQQGRNKETLEFGAKILKQYGVNFIAEPSLVQVFPQLIKSKMMLAGKDISELANAPAMTDTDKLDALRILLNISATAYVYNPNTMLLLVNKMTQISLQYGNAPESAFAYGLFGFIEGAALSNFKNSQLFSELSQTLNNKVQDPIIIGKVKYLKCFANQHWYEPIQNSFPLLRESYHILHNSGSYVFASYALMTLSCKELYIGLPIPRVYKTAIEYSDFANRVNENYTENLLTVLSRFMSGLSGIYDAGYRATDLEDFNEERFTKELQDNRLTMALAWHYVYTEALHYLFDRQAEAGQYLIKAAIVDEGAPIRFCGCNSVS